MMPFRMMRSAEIILGPFFAVITKKLPRCPMVSLSIPRAAHCTSSIEGRHYGWQGIALSASHNRLDLLVWDEKLFGRERPPLSAD